MSTKYQSTIQRMVRTLKTKKATIASFCLMAVFAGSMLTPFASTAEAHRRHYDDDRYYGRDYGYRYDRRPMVSYKTGKILKGGLVGAGIGAGSAVVFDKPMLKSSLIGAGIGAGVQALRYSDW